MTKISNSELYEFIGEFLKSILSHSSGEMIKFGITHPIYEEILEELERSGEEVDKLCLPPYTVAFIPDSTGRIPIDLFEIGTPPQNRRVSCLLWTNEVKSELILTADLVEGIHHISLVFRLLGTQ